MIRSLMMVKLESFLITLSYGTGGLYMIWIHPPTPPPPGVGEGAPNRVRKKPGFGGIVEFCGG